jgi:hypothetical protein
MTDAADAIEVLRSKPVVDPPSPWRKVPVHIAGVTAVGFAPGTDLVVVLSHDGIGVVDAGMGDVLARQYDTELEDDPYPVWVRGIGPVQDQRIPVAGLWGGGLRRYTPDGWWVSVVAPDWPDESVVLMPPGLDEVLDNPEQAWLIVDGSDSEVRACGFSDTGQTLVVATTELYLWTRNTQADE